MAKKITVISLTVLSVIVIYFVFCINTLPNSIFVKKGEVQTVDLPVPVSIEYDKNTVTVAMQKGDTLAGKSTSVDISATESSVINLKLFGVPVKQMQVNVAESYDGSAAKLIVGGHSLGVTLHTKGALVVGISDITDLGGNTVSPGKNAGLLPGDVIISVNGTAVTDADHLSEMLNSHSGDEIILGVMRDGDEFEVNVDPVQDSYDSVVRLGIWVRDSTAGVGTLTFYEPYSGMFAGLGHAITDVDTGSILTVDTGKIIFSDVTEIVKGSKGSPGEIRGEFSYSDDVIGDLEKNAQFGIYGHAENDIDNALYPAPVEVGTRSSVESGPATLLTTVDSQGIREFSCMISAVADQDAPAQKSFVITVTDEELIDITGGIIQGMSGSPIIQNGRIIGALTHVFVDDPCIGYGVYIEWMLDEMHS